MVCFGVKSSLVVALAAMVVVATTHAQEYLRSKRFAVDKMTILYQTFAKGKVYCHYNAGNGWTPGNGVEMKPTASWNKDFPAEKGWYDVQIAEAKSTLEFDFVVDGVWDNNNKNNYFAYAKGLWAVSSPLNPQPVQVETHDGSGATRVLFQRPSSWGQGPTWIHYRETNGKWTTLPGVAMKESSYSGFYGYVDYRTGAAEGDEPSSWDYSFLGWVQFDLPVGSEGFEMTFNDGHGNWDNNNGNNFRISKAGVWAFLPTIA